MEASTKNISVILQLLHANSQLQAKKAQIKESLQILVFSNVLLSTEIKRKQITIFLQSI